MCDEKMLKRYGSDFIRFLEPYLELANCHMVDFFTRDLYRTALPPNIRKEIDHVGPQAAVQYFFDQNFACLPNLSELINKCDQYILKNSPICLSCEDFIAMLKSWGGSDLDRFKLEVFMSPKKSHEVEVASAIIAAIFNLNKTTHLIDIGDGKGYLSSMLALRYKIPVLGIDASNINTRGAIKRVTKLSRIWNSVEKSPYKSYPGKGDIFQSFDTKLYQQITEFVDTNCDLQQMISAVFQLDTTTNLGLIGLHTCGNLGPDTLKIFANNQYIKTICNIGCCYHLITEYCEDCSNYGFPLSDYLREKQIEIGRNARMVAAQSVDRVVANRSLPNISIYYRALLQIVYEKYCKVLPTKQVGRFRKPCADFVDYARKANNRLSVNLEEITDDTLEEFDQIYKSKLDELNIFYLIRSKLGAVVESLILLDRLLYLKEKDFNNSYIVQLFDPVISPRCYGIISIKN